MLVNLKSCVLQGNCHTSLVLHREGPSGGKKPEDRDGKKPEDRDAAGLLDWKVGTSSGALGLWTHRPGE